MLARWIRLASSQVSHHSTMIRRTYVDYHWTTQHLQLQLPTKLIPSASPDPRPLHHSFHTSRSTFTQPPHVDVQPQPANVQTPPSVAMRETSQPASWLYSNDFTEFNRSQAGAQFEQANQTLALVSQTHPGSPEHIRALRQMAVASMIRSMEDGMNADAERMLMEALDYQQKIYTHAIEPHNFIIIVEILFELVANVRLGGNHLHQINTFINVYGKAKERLLQADPIYVACLEHPAVYTLICYLSMCLMDAKQFERGKEFLATHLLHDLSTSSPSTKPGFYRIRDLRLATALNFRGLAAFKADDLEAAETAWHKAYTFTMAFTNLLRTSKPVSDLSPANDLMLRTTCSILDNLVRVARKRGDMSDVPRFSQEKVLLLATLYPSTHPKLVAAEADYLMALWDGRQLDEAKIVAEKMLAAFPQTDGITHDILDEVVLELSRIYGDLVDFFMDDSRDFKYAEKFGQITLRLLLAISDSQDPAVVKSVPPTTNSRLECDLANAYRRLGRALYRNQKYEEAEVNLLKAYELYQPLLDDSGVFNRMNVDFGPLCTLLTAVHLFGPKEDVKMALVFSHEAVKFKSKLFGSLSPLFLDDIANTAYLHYKLNEFSSAIPLYKQLITIIDLSPNQTVLDGEEVCLTYHRLARAYEQSQPPQLRLAADVWRRAIANSQLPQESITGLQLHRHLRRVLVELKLEEEVKELDATIAKNERKQPQAKQAVDASSIAVTSVR